MDPPKFIFINAPDLASVQSTKERRSLRSQMMTQFLQEQRKQRLRVLKNGHPRIVQSEVGTALICRCEPVLGNSELGRVCASCGGHISFAKAVQCRSSPLSMLGSGRSDPFASHSIAQDYPEFHQLTDYCVTVLWPGFRTRDDYPKEFYRAWVQPMGENPLVSYTTLYFVSIHLDALALKKGAINHPLHTKRQLHYRDQALKLLRQVLTHPKRDFDLDDTVGAILDLAVNETRRLMDLAPKDPSPFMPPLVDKQWLGFLGACNYNPTHWTAVCTLVEQHGGIRSLKRFGLAWLTSLSGVMSASAHQTKPPFPLIEPNGQPFRYLPPLEYLNIDEDPWHGNPKRNSFQQLRYLGIRKGIVRILNDLGELSQAIETWTQERYQFLDTDGLCDIRNLVQHRLLSLPTRSDALETILEDDATTMEKTLLAVNIYQMCRLAALLYSIHVTFPIPNSLALRKIMRSELLSAIQAFDVLSVNPENSTVVLWCAMVGGIAADNGCERPAYASELDRLSSWLGMTSWGEMQLVLRSCAWLDTACNAGGHALWKEALSPPDEVIEGP